jgi:hypothetical protein
MSTASPLQQPLRSSSPGSPPSLKLRRAGAGKPRRSLLTAEVHLRTKAVGGGVAALSSASPRRRPGSITTDVSCKWRCGPSMRNNEHLGLWVLAFARTTVNVWLRFAFQRANTTSPSRGTICPSFAFRRPSKAKREQGMPGARCTRGLVCRVAQKKAHTSIQVQRRHSGIPCAVVLRLMPCSPRRANSSCHRRCRLDGYSNPVGSL